MKGRYNIRETREANSSTNECLTISHTKSLHETNIELTNDDSYLKLSLFGYTSSFIATEMSFLSSATFNGSGDSTTYSNIISNKLFKRSLFIND